MKYRKKPEVIEAMQFTADTKSNDVIKVFGEDPIEPDMNGYFIPTFDSVMEVNVGDYIIKGVQGEFYSCKPGIFEATYEKLEDK